MRRIAFRTRVLSKWVTCSFVKTTEWVGRGFLEYLEDFRVVVSRPCATGVVPWHLATHLWTHHRYTHKHFISRPAAERRAQNSYLPLLPSVPLNSYNAPLLMPPTKSELFPGLDVHHGLGRRHCDYTRKNGNEMGQCYNVTHALALQSRGSA